MEKYIAILRAINVGANRKVLMVDLKKLFEDLGFINIQTYIQSGNVIFESKEKNIPKISEILAQNISQKFGFEVPVIVISKTELDNAILENPFVKSEENNIENLHLTFLKTIPDTENLEVINKLNFEPDLFEIIGKNAFIFCKGKYSDTKLNNQFFEKKLKVNATTRNWKTVLKLQAMAKEN